MASPGPFPLVWFLLAVVPIVIHSIPSLKEEQMNRFTTLVRRFVKDDEAATMVEYALMLSLIAVVCIAMVTIVGTNARDIFDTVGQALPA
jgi:pilus assembly protein Flp/PilA